MALDVAFATLVAVFFVAVPLLAALAGGAALVAAVLVAAAVLLAAGEPDFAAGADLAAADLAAGLAAGLVARAVVVARVGVAATARFGGAAVTCTSTPALSSARRTAFWRAAVRPVLSKAARTSSPVRARTEPADISCWRAGSENSEGSAALARLEGVEPVDTDTDYLSQRWTCEIDAHRGRS